MATQHTPVPWLYDGRFTVTIPHSRGYIPFRVQPEDAEFIVRAVNCHEQLVEACIESLEVFLALNDGVVSITDAREKCRAALTAATGSAGKQPPPRA